MFWIYLMSFHKTLVYKWWNISTSADFALKINLSIMSMRTPYEVSVPGMFHVKKIFDVLRNFTNVQNIVCVGTNIWSWLFSTYVIHNQIGKYLLVKLHKHTYSQYLLRECPPDLLNAKMISQVKFHNWTNTIICNDVSFITSEWCNIFNQFYKFYKL